MMRAFFICLIDTVLFLSPSRAGSLLQGNAFQMQE